MQDKSNLPKEKKTEFPQVEVVLPEFRIPIQTQAGTMLLSKRELTAVNIYLQHAQNYPVMVKALKQELGDDTSLAALQKMLQSEHVQNYVQDRLRDMGMVAVTKDQWEREAIEFRDGIRPSNKSTVAMHKLLGMSMGFLSSKADTVVNQQINFIEKGGDE